MNSYTLQLGAKDVLNFKTPTGRKDINYEQWTNAFEYLQANKQLSNEESNNNEETVTSKGLYNICKIIEALGTGITFEQLRKINTTKLTNLYIMDFAFLSKETPQRKFIVDGKKIDVPDFSKETAGDFMDAMDLLGQIKDKENDADIGLTITAIYIRGGEYFQDIDKINERKEWLKKYARMDLFFSVGFFLQNFIQNARIFTKQPTKQVEELEKLTSSLSDLDIMRYLRPLLRRDF